MVPWIGGKRRLADILIPQFPPRTCYVEVFAGAAALFFLWRPVEVEVLNDVNDDNVLHKILVISSICIASCSTIVRNSSVSSIG